MGSFIIVILTLVVSTSTAFNFCRHNNRVLLSTKINQARRSKDNGANLPEVVAPTFVVGEDVPEEILKQNTIYDMILVERFNAPEQRASGLFLPKIEGQDRKHLAKVLSVPTNYGLESEQGRLQGIDEIAPYKVGDTVYIKVTHIS